MHTPEVDRICPMCGMNILVYIAHECDPFICVACQGSGRQRSVSSKLKEIRDCIRCAGTGRWAPEPHDDECEVCNPKGGEA
jgi:DnaJ-class molecular chaperone